MRKINTAAFDALFGNERLKQVIIPAALSGSLAHAYIFEGKKGSGRHTAAMLTAGTLVCRSDTFPCGSCDSCRRLREGLTTDIMIVTPEKERKTIGVEAVRAIAETVYVVPNDLPVRLYIIPDADIMTVPAQNALLKLLEEPPSGVYFFLLCENSANLLPTVRSRAPSIKMQSFTDDVLLEYIVANDNNAAKLNVSDHAALERGVKLADGSIGAALSLLNAKKSAGNASLFERAERFMQLLSEGNDAELLSFTLGMASKREELSELLLLISEGARDLISLKYGAKFRPLFFSDVKTALKLAGVFSAERLFILAAQSERISNELQSNVNLNSALTVYASELMQP